MRSAAFVLLLLTASAANAADLPSVDPKTGAVLPPMQASSLLKQCSRNVPVDITGAWQPTPKQIGDLEARLPFALAAAWPDHVRADLNASPKYDPDFARQYAGLESHGRKFVYVNAFPLHLVDFDGTNLSPAADIDWHKNAIMVCDGGDRFWGVEYDPQTKTFSHFEFNGAL